MTDGPALRSDPLALVRSIAPPTPLEPAPGLVPGRDDVLLKREDTGPTGAFKWRGALCACTALRDAGAAGVVTSSTGNHGAATAWAAARLGLEAHIVVPQGASRAKSELIAEQGARLQRTGATLDESALAARALADELGLPFFEDGASEAQLLGTGTIGSELAGQGIDVVVVPLACGALAGGLARALKAAPDPPSIVGVQSEAFVRLGALWRGDPDPGTAGGRTFAGGLADNRIVEPAFGACRAHLDDVLAVDDEALRAAVRELHERCDILVEGAGAAALAALLEHPDRIPPGRTALVLSGRNLDRADAVEILGRT
jgi:threonine dehydratase